MFSVIFAINGLGIILAGQITAKMARRYGEQSILNVGLFMALIGGVTLVLAALLHTGLLLILPALFVVVASVGVVGTIATALAMQSQGQNAGAAAGLLGATQMLLGALASPMVGLGGSETDWPMAIVIASCEVLGVLVYASLGAKRRAPRAIDKQETVSE